MPEIFRAVVTTVRSGKLNEDSTAYHFVLTIFMLFSLVIIGVWSSGHFAHALYFGHNSSIIASSQSPLISSQIAATEKGNVYVVWGDKNYIFSSSSQDNGTKFSVPILLSNSNKLASSPQIAATEKGDVYVVWVDKNSTGGNSDIKFRSSNDSGKSFGGAKKLQGGNIISSSPQIAATKRGDVYVVWVDKDGISGDTDIKFRSSNDSGRSFDNGKRLSVRNDILSSSPQVAATKEGNVYVVRVDKNSISGEIDIVIRVSTDSGQNFSNGLNLNEDPIEMPISSPQIAATENGYAYVVWYQNDVHFKEILDDGATLGRTVFPGNSTSSTSSPQIAATEKGDVYVVWVDKKSPNKDSILALKRIGEFFIAPNS